MYNLKGMLFLELTKNQKASLLSFLKSFVKKHSEKNTQDIIQLFIEDETYYFEQGVPHFEWIITEFEKESFLEDVRKYIEECKKQLEQKTAQKPFYEKQKAIYKEQKQKAREFKLSKEKPTKKQIYYYDKLCKKYGLAKESIDSLSRLDLMKMIGKIVDEHKDTEIVSGISVKNL